MNRLPYPDPHVVFCEVAEGAVLLSTAEEVYYGLNSVGARVWKLLPPKYDNLEELCSVLALEYPEVDAEDLRADIAALLDDLVRSRLVVPA
jgi:hypothetical protein